MVDGSHDILAVPITATNLERTGIITEALSAESYKRVIPAYYETALKTKYARDDESVQMLDMIANSRGIRHRLRIRRLERRVVHISGADFREQHVVRVDLGVKTIVDRGAL